MDDLQISSDNPNISTSFYGDIKNIITEARSNAVRSVDFQRVLMYWRLGERIFVEEQRGKDRAGYGTYLIKNLVTVIEPEFGSGFGYRQLNRARQFYRAYPIVTALRSQLNWYQYRQLIFTYMAYTRCRDYRCFFKRTTYNNNTRS
jgi:hypothetical protein